MSSMKIHKQDCSRDETLVKVSTKDLPISSANANPFLPGGPALDIERAFNKLEKVAIRSCAKRDKPLVLIVNNVHFLKNDDDGRNILLQLQQHAESWAASGMSSITTYLVHV